MDKLDQYATILESVVKEWGEIGQRNDPANGTFDFTICDRESNNFLLVSASWREMKRQHNIIFHAHIEEGKVWVEWDGTDPSITEELMRLGIPRQDIVLGHVHPTRRALAEPRPEMVVP